MKNRYFFYLLSFLSMSLLSGCGGGGGGTASAITQTTFTDWNSIVKPTQVNLNGISTDASYSTDAAITKVTSITNQGTDLTTNTSITYRSNGTISKISTTTQNGTVTFDEDLGHTIGDTGSTIYGWNNNGQDFMLAANPLYSGLNWNYQTFGIWETGRGTGSGTAGGISVGTATAGSSIPTSSSATYSGVFGGAGIDAAGTDFLTRGNVSVSADFSNRSLAFSTSGTNYIIPVTSTPTWTSLASLNMSGTLTYSAATNSFTGSVSDSFIGGSGTATGKFYGPNAEELGGVYNIDGTGVKIHAGAFGAKK